MRHGYTLAPKAFPKLRTSSAFSQVWAPHYTNGNGRGGGEGWFCSLLNNSETIRATVFIDSSKFLCRNSLQDEKKIIPKKFRLKNGQKPLFLP